MLVIVRFPMASARESTCKATSLLSNSLVFILRKKWTQTSWVTAWELWTLELQV